MSYLYDDYDDFQDKSFQLLLKVYLQLVRINEKYLQLQKVGIQVFAGSLNDHKGKPVSNLRVKNNLKVASTGIENCLISGVCRYLTKTTTLMFNSNAIASLKSFSVGRAKITKFYLSMRNKSKFLSTILIEVLSFTL